MPLQMKTYEKERDMTFQVMPMSLPFHVIIGRVAGLELIIKMPSVVATGPHAGTSERAAGYVAGPF